MPELSELTAIPYAEGEFQPVRNRPSSVNADIRPALYSVTQTVFDAESMAIPCGLTTKCLVILIVSTPTGYKSPSLVNF
jgi:hypothetical protein